MRNEYVQYINGHISILAKKEDCSFYSGIMLLSVPGLILSKILLNKIKKKVNENLRPNQAEFRPNRSTIDLITILRIIIEQSKEWNSGLFVKFIDYKKAFDSLNRKSLWKICLCFAVWSQNMVSEYSCGLKIFKSNVLSILPILPINP